MECHWQEHLSKESQSGEPDCIRNWDAGRIFECHHAGREKECRDSVVKEPTDE